MTIGTLITLCVIVFSAGSSYALINSQLKRNTKSIKNLIDNTSTLKLYIERQLTSVSMRIDELQKIVEKHDELFKLMGFNTKEDVRNFMQKRR